MRKLILSGVAVLATVACFGWHKDEATAFTKIVAFPEYSSANQDHPIRPCKKGTMAIKYGTNGNTGTKLYMCLSTASASKRWYSSTFSNVSAR